MTGIVFVTISQLMLEGVAGIQYLNKVISTAESENQCMIQFKGYQQILFGGFKMRMGI